MARCNREPSAGGWRRGSGWRIAAAVVAFAVHDGFGAESDAPTPPPLAQARLARSLEEAAKRDGIRLFHLDAIGSAPSTGDSVVAWVGAHDGKVTRQWLVQLRRDAATLREARTWQGRSQTRYLAWGPVVQFRSEAEALEVWLAGPVDIPEPETSEPVRPAPTKRLRVSVPGDYLRLGLHEAALVNLHIGRRVAEFAKEGQEVNMGQIYSLDRPIKPEIMGYSRPVAEQLGLTEEMSRAWVGGSVALQAFYEIANEVPELRSIAATAVAKPPAWKLPKLAFGTHFKSTLGGGQTRTIDAAEAGLLPVSNESYVLEFGMSFGDDPLVFGEMVATWPTPPLDVSAGILGLVAVHPKDHDRKVQVAIIASQRGGTVEQTASSR